MDDADRTQAATERYEDAALKAYFAGKTNRGGRNQGLKPQGSGPSSRVFCKDCGNPIPKERLEALPETERCVPCQRLYERERA